VLQEELELIHNNKQFYLGRVLSDFRGHLCRVRVLRDLQYRGRVLRDLQYRGRVREILIYLRTLVHNLLVIDIFDLLVVHLLSKYKYK
jgi:hypothetical protein